MECWTLQMKRKHEWTSDNWFPVEMEKSGRNIENKMKINNEKYTISTECYQ